jgi:hypothetical protein
MSLTLVAERREPSDETLKSKAKTVGLAPNVTDFSSGTARAVR